MVSILHTGPDRKVLVSVTFGRTPVWKGAIQHRIRYDMEKVTAFGIIRSEAFVLMADITARGMDVVDGEMFSKLSRAIHEEENSRLLEGGATLEFGVDAA